MSIVAQDSSPFNGRSARKEFTFGVKFCPESTGEFHEDDESKTPSHFEQLNKQTAFKSMVTVQKTCSTSVSASSSPLSKFPNITKRNSECIIPASDLVGAEDKETKTKSPRRRSLMDHLSTFAKFIKNDSPDSEQPKSS